MPSGASLRPHIPPSMADFFLRVFHFMKTRSICCPAPPCARACRRPWRIFFARFSFYENSRHMPSGASLRPHMPPSILFFLPKKKKACQLLLTFFLKLRTILTHSRERDAPLAQLVEQWTVNPCVAGSSPAGGAKRLELSSRFFYLQR